MGRPFVSALLTGEPDLSSSPPRRRDWRGCNASLCSLRVKRDGIATRRFPLPWRDMGVSALSPTLADAKCFTVLSYLKENGDQIYNDTYSSVGLPGMEMYKSGEADDYRATHPALILAALYLLCIRFGVTGAANPKPSPS